MLSTHLSLDSLTQPLLATDCDCDWISFHLPDCFDANRIMLLTASSTRTET
jgi:hypothetical protein